MTPATRAASKTSAALPPNLPENVNKIMELLESLHAKIDALPKCECNSLREELSDLKKLIVKPLDSISTPPPETTYAAVKKALSDAATYADKAKRAVWVGREECSIQEETLASDQKAIEVLCAELNDPSITKALSDGDIRHHHSPSE